MPEPSDKINMELEELLEESRTINAHQTANLSKMLSAEKASVAIFVDDVTVFRQERRDLWLW